MGERAQPIDWLRFAKSRLARTMAYKLGSFRKIGRRHMARELGSFRKFRLGPQPAMLILAAFRKIAPA